MTYTVKEFCGQVRSEFYKAREIYDEIRAKIDELEVKAAEISHNPNLSPAGIANETAANLEAREALRAELYGLKNDASARADAIIKRCEGVFRGYYTINPDMLDGGMIALINAGIVSDDELMELTQTRYAHNPSMRRYMAAEAIKRADESENHDALLQFAMSIEAANAIKNPHLTALDDIKTWGEKVINPNNPKLADAYFSEFTAVTGGIIDAAPEVTATEAGDSGIYSYS